MSHLKLLSPLNSGHLHFKNRVFMAPLTRSRAVGEIPNEMMARYYAQRASAGLIISEGTQISSQGVGYINTPGIYTPSQIAGWKKITDAVHGNNGLIFCQLWHVGRVSHPDFHAGSLPIGPSAIGFKAQVFTPEGFKDTVIPRALSLVEIKEIIEDYRKAAQAAKQAGFDGVEIHAANGYLPHQFLEDGSNQRTDEYGGTIQNRSRFLLEILSAVSEVWDTASISVRLSPRNPIHGMYDSYPKDIYHYLVRELNNKQLGILHFVEPACLPEGVEALADNLKSNFDGIVVLNKEYNKVRAERVIQEGKADAVSFGTLFISNPDLPQRFLEDAPLAPADQRTYYTGGEKGYTSYPSLISKEI